MCVQSLVAGAIPKSMTTVCKMLDQLVAQHYVPNPQQPTERTAATAATAAAAAAVENKVGETEGMQQQQQPPQQPKEEGGGEGLN
jgi:hypothetical protein